MDSGRIWQCAAGIPEEWYEGDRDALERLVEEMSKRRGIIRKLICDFRRSPRNPFPNWRESPISVGLPAGGQDEPVGIR